MHVSLVFSEAVASFGASIAFQTTFTFQLHVILVMRQFEKKL